MFNRRLRDIKEKEKEKEKKRVEVGYTYTTITVTRRKRTNRFFFECFLLYIIFNQKKINSNT